MENIDKIANIDAIANAIKNNSEDGFFFVPWIGKNYDNGLKGSKILVVGASHYCNHSNICIHPYNNKDCSNYNCLNRCNLGCDYFLDCTSENTKRYNKDCAWMKKEEYSKSYEILCNEIDEKIYDCKMIFEKLKSTTLGEVCNFLDTEWGDNNSFEKFSEFCIEYFFEGKCYKEGSSGKRSDNVSIEQKKTAEHFVYLNNHKQIYKNEQQFSISCMGALQS